MEISSSIPKKESVTIPKEIQQLEDLIREGKKQKRIFENQLNIILKNDPNEKKILLQQYNFIIQSAILLKTDLKQNNCLYNKSSLNQAHYLYKNSAVLIDKIYYHCSQYKENKPIKPIEN